MIFSFISKKVLAVSFIGAAILLGLFAWYYNHSQSRIENLQRENISLSTSLEISKQSIEDIQENYAFIMEELDRVNTEFSDIQYENQILKERFEGHDLSRLAFNKPEWIEKIINSGSEKAIRCFEILSGSPLTEQEQNAKSPKEFNSECPALWNNPNFN